MSGQMYRFYVRLLIAVSVLTLLTSTSAIGKVIHVDDDANAPGDGKSWVTAYRYLQDALANAKAADKPVEVWVAQGLYKPDQGGGISLGDRGAIFHLINGVRVRGGYAGWGMSDPNARDVALYPTILSGDLLGNDLQTSDTWHLLNEPNRVENSYHIVTGSGAGTTAILDGFTISQGNFTPVSDRDPSGGGGMYNNSGSPRVIGCFFTKNAARDMGGVYNKNQSNPVLINCVFSKNWAGQGGAIANYRGSNPLIINCTFARNSAGVYASGNSKANLTNCIVWGNGTFDEPSQIRGDAIVNYCCIQGWTGLGGTGNMGQDPLFVDPNGEDYHLKSQAGRWDRNHGSWVLDDLTSACIDAGDPNSLIGDEPFPNGGRINMGAYGGTEEASKSYFGGLACETIVAGDINGDCKVDFRDLAIMAMRWLEDRTAHRIVTTTYRLVEDKSSVVSYGGRRIEKHAIAGTFDLTVDFTAAKAMFERVDVTSDQTMSFIDYRKEGEPIYTDELDRMFHMTQLVSTDVNDTEARFVFHKNIPSFPGADIHVTVAFEGDSVSIAGKFSDPVADGCWHDLNAVAVPVRDP